MCYNAIEFTAYPTENLARRKHSSPKGAKRGVSFLSLKS